MDRVVAVSSSATIGWIRFIAAHSRSRSSPSTVRAVTGNRTAPSCTMARGRASRLRYHWGDVSSPACVAPTTSLSSISKAARGTVRARPDRRPVTVSSRNRVGTLGIWEPILPFVS